MSRAGSVEGLALSAEMTVHGDDDCSRYYMRRDSPPAPGDPKTRNDGTAERRKTTPNPKTRNRGKSPIILKR